MDENLEKRRKKRKLDLIKAKIAIASIRPLLHFPQWGKTSVGWFYGLKYHLVINQNGELMNFYISSGNVSYANALVLFQLTKNLKSWLFGDRGYLLNEEKRDLLERDGLLRIFLNAEKI